MVLNRRPGRFSSRPHYKQIETVTQEQLDLFAAAAVHVFVNKQNPQDNLSGVNKGAGGSSNVKEEVKNNAGAGYANVKEEVVYDNAAATANGIKTMVEVKKEKIEE